MAEIPEFEAIIKNCAKLQIVAFLKTIFPGSVKAGKTFAKFGGSEQKTCVDGLNILGAVQLFTADDRLMPILCCAKQMDGTLTERSSRRKQFDESVKVLKEVFAHPYAGNGAMQGAFTQGLFFFFDMDGNFRLSLVTSEIVNGKQELNNYRRQSFFVSAGARNNTFRTRICKKIGSYEDLKNAFDVEKLSDEFFHEYKVFYEDIVQYVTGARYIEVKKNKYERAEMSVPNHDIFDQFVNAYGNDAEKAVRNYVKKLMGRLVFIQFLQKKGWLGIPMGTDGWTGGDKDFLQHLFDNVSPEEQNSFVDKVLEEVLFYSFNRKESERKLKNSTLKKFKFPFLNCGLFDKDRDDEFDFALPGEVFHNKTFHETERKAPDIKNWTKKLKPYFNDEMCGLFDFFDRFNFTIDENDPTDADVSVDPEMLGKIFENLLEDNKDKGAFYTPKEIVGYMCNESLIAYLQSETKFTEEKLRNLVVDLNADAFDDSEKNSLDEKLSEVKICDPAIGSGAFPMGLLNLLYKTRLKLGVVQKKSKNPEATLKREIIQQNIYGVDIEKGAVDIAQLRFWLSLVVDEVEPDALPNLEYKIMQGNSLLESYDGIDLSTLAGEGKNRSRGKANDQMSLVFDEKQAMEQIQKDLNSFYKTDDYNVKEHLKKDINLNVKNYIKHIAPEKSKAIDELPLPNDKFFLWHTYFRDVFDRKGKSGFDIVIGNPPYLLCQPSNTEESLLEYYRTHFQVASYKIDLFHLFFEEGIYLCRKDGVLSYITPNTYLTNKYIKSLRQFILGNCDILRLVLHDKVFESAQVDNATIIMKNGKEKHHQVTIEKCENFKFHRFTIISQDQWENDADFVFNVQKEFTLESNFKLGDIASVTFGLQTADKKTYVKESPMGDKWEPCYTGRDVSRYYLSAPSLYFLNDPIKVKAGGSWNMKIHHASKIVTRQIGAPEPIFALDEYGVATLNTMYSILVENKEYSEKFILGLCCSKLIKFWWLSKFADNKALFPKIKGFQLKEIPIPEATLVQQQPIANFVDFILAAKKKDPSADTSKQEAEIDKLVYELYGLTDEEIAIVEGREVASSTSSRKVAKTAAAKDKVAASDDWLSGEEL